MIDSIDTTVAWNRVDDTHQVLPDVDLHPETVVLFLTKRHFNYSSRSKTYVDLDLNWTNHLLEPIRARLYDEQISEDLTILDLPAG